jgi:hypothetical protein
MHKCGVCGSWSSIASGVCCGEVFVLRNRFFCDFCLVLCRLASDFCRDLVDSQFIVVIRDLNINSELFCECELVNMSVLRLDLVILAHDVDDLFKIQTLNEILGDHERSTNHNIVNVLTAESHQNSF